MVDWSRRDWWLRAMACLHHASGGSEAGFELSCAASGGDASMGLVGCPAKFCADDQRRVWDSLAAGEHPELRGQPSRSGPSIGSLGATVAGRPAAAVGPWGSRGPIGKFLRRLRPWPKPGDGRCRWASIAHVRCTRRWPGSAMLNTRSMVGCSRRSGAGWTATTGVAAIGSLTGMAGTLGCATETLRRYLRQLAKRA